MERINLCTPVRQALAARNVSTVKVVDAVNAALGQLEAGKVTNRLGDGSVSKTAYSVSHAVTTKFSGKRNMPLDFDAFNGMVAKIEKKFPSFACNIPEQFNEWLDKMVITKTVEQEA